MSVVATAKVKLTIEVDAHSTWGKGCTTQQVYDQASSGVTATIRKRLAGFPGIRILGEPEVMMVIVPQDKES